MEHTNHPCNERNHPNKKAKKQSRILRKIGFALFTLLSVGALTIAIFFKIFMTYVNTTLVPTLDVTVEELTMSEASTIYYQDSSDNWVAMETLHQAEGNRKIVEYEDLPEHLIDAVVAIEDKRFWEHKGVDWKGTTAAFVKTFTSGSTRGGSSITQQFLRNITKDNEVTVKRKVREIFRALEFEKKYSKEDIITLYLNYVYFGSGCDGVQTAAEKYFGKDVSQLSVAECAAIIGITNNPSLYDPFRNAEFVQSDGSVKTPRDFNKVRQETILKEMLDQGKLTQSEYEAAVNEKLLFTDTPEYQALYGDSTDEDGEDTVQQDNGIYSWFVDAAIEEAIQLIMEAKNCSKGVAEDLLFSAGYHIYTTLDMNVQKVVDEVYTNLDNFDYPSQKGTQLDSAITITDPYTGDVLAMAGGVGEKQYSRSLNLATASRPCGSAIKPLSVYAPAIDGGLISPASVYDDYPITLNEEGTNGYPKNSNNKYRGFTTVSYAVQWSTNTVACRVLQELGYETSYYFMNQKLGFHLVEADKDMGPLAMGGLTYGVSTVEMAAAYGTFANDGIYSSPRMVIRILANDGVEVIAENPVVSNIVLKESTVYLMNRLLQSVVSSGTGTSASFSGMTIGGKTGTTSNNFDRYFVGYTPYYSAAVWVGYAQSNEKINAGSKNPAALVWKKVMSEIHEGLESKSFGDRPDDIVKVDICEDCGLLANELCLIDQRGSRIKTIEVQEEAAPTETCTCHVEAYVCTDPETHEMHLAGEYCPEETCSTKIFLVGREYLSVLLETPIVHEDGTEETESVIFATDDDYTLSHLTQKGVCPAHEGYEEGDGEVVPGDPEWVDPMYWDDPTEPGETVDPTTPEEPSEPSTR